MPLVIIDPFRRARDLLGVDVDAGPKDIRRAYRKATMQHPPDRDPDGFREVRQAYELLTDPLPRAKELLEHPVPHIPPPPLPTSAADTREPGLPCAVLRAIVGQMPVSHLLGEEP